MGKKEGEVMKDLIYKHGFFQRKESLDFQGVCSISPYAPKVSIPKCYRYMMSQLITSLFQGLLNSDFLLTWDWLSCLSCWLKYNEKTFLKTTLKFQNYKHCRIYWKQQNKHASKLIPWHQFCERCIPSILEFLIGLLYSATCHERYPNADMTWNNLLYYWYLVKFWLFTVFYPMLFSHCVRVYHKL